MLPNKKSIPESLVCYAITPASQMLTFMQTLNCSESSFKQQLTMKQFVSGGKKFSVMLEVNTEGRDSALPTTSNLKGINVRLTANKINYLSSKLPQH